MSDIKKEDWYKTADKMLNGHLGLSPELINELNRVQELMNRIPKKFNNEDVIAGIISRYIKVL